MRKAVLSIILATCLEGMLSARSLSLLTPNGGEELIAGQRKKIMWQYDRSVLAVSLEYSDSNGLSWHTIVRSTQNDGEYEYSQAGYHQGQEVVRDCDSNRYLQGHQEKNSGRRRNNAEIHE